MNPAINRTVASNAYQLAPRTPQATRRSRTLPQLHAIGHLPALAPPHGCHRTPTWMPTHRASTPRHLQHLSLPQAQELPTAAPSVRSNPAGLATNPHASSNPWIWPGNHHINRWRCRIRTKKTRIRTLTVHGSRPPPERVGEGVPPREGKRSGEGETPHHRPPRASTGFRLVSLVAARPWGGRR